MKRPVESPV